MEWLVTAVAVLALGFHQIFTFDVSPRPNWFPSPDATAGIMIGLTAGLAGALVATTAMIRRAALDGKRRARSRRSTSSCRKRRAST